MSRLLEAMITKLIVHTAANVIELFIRLFYIAWLKARDIFVRFIKAMRVRCFSFRLLVIACLWDSTRWSAWSSWTYQFNILKSCDLDRRYQQYCDTINRNPGILQFDLHQNQTCVCKHFFFIHETSQQLFTRQQCSNVIFIWEICWITSLFKHIVSIATAP